MSIPLVDGTIIELQNVALALRCNSNLILLDKLQEIAITYHNDPSSMTLMRGNKTIARTKKSHNLITLNLAMPDQIMSAIKKAMVMTGWG